eukprot:UN14059
MQVEDVVPEAGAAWNIRSLSMRGMYTNNENTASKPELKCDPDHVIGWTLALITDR